VRSFVDHSGYSSSGWRLALRLVCWTLAFWAQAAASQVVALPETVEVSGATIPLAQLLPRHSSLALRQASVAIELGRSPQPGSFRVLEAGQIMQVLSQRPDLLRQLAIPDRILVRRSGWVVQRAAIRAAIGRFLPAKSDNRDFTDSTLQALDDIAAQAEDPALEVTGLTRDVRGRGFEFRLRCVPRALCSSFVAHLLDPEPGSSGFGSSGLTGAIASMSSLPSAAKATGPILAEAGKKAMLLLDDGSMSISLPVTCLERGRLSQKIRVLDASSHRILHAEVVGAGKVHASL
jgi:hypothetical protein